MSIHSKAKGARLVTDSIAAMIGGFERTLRMFYPGLLFWVLFPTALPVDNNPGLSSLDLWKGYYGDLSALGHAGVITFSGLFLYITWLCWGR